ncbi:hypothetical protein BC830DRAFT_475697 [Chytriomyces sp. MP71]|nr:hypothetical protein BC830DRAFT_475697 [Chytriomyces sp. MP71]
MSCFTLSTDSICGPAFAGVGISTRFGFTSEPQFNAFIANEASAPAIASYFSCPAAGTALLAGVQYQLSISCASAAYNSAMQYGCASAPGGSGSVGLCAGACEAAVQSFQEALGGCAGAKVSQAVALFAKDCSQFAGLGGTCWNGTPQDVANCGKCGVL